MKISAIFRKAAEQLAEDLETTVGDYGACAAIVKVCWYLERGVDYAELATKYFGLVFGQNPGVYWFGDPRFAVCMKDRSIFELMQNERITALLLAAEVAESEGL